MQGSVVPQESDQSLRGESMLRCLVHQVLVDVEAEECVQGGAPDGLCSVWSSPPPAAAAQVAFQFTTFCWPEPEFSLVLRYLKHSGGAIWEPASLLELCIMA